ncbi:MAG: dihydropteroate synthase [Cyclobacteriaceae bacterium]|nr:dihydropteroate synthase [Cyclobacteriaceae bacterium]MCH8516732.1 dihydropteroate synthase [Cyclobacteriaceae bacterium]
MNPFDEHYTWNCQGKLRTINGPQVMAILNVTDDSFYDGGRYTSKSTIQTKIQELLWEKVDIIDVGGCSTRPGAQEVSETQELDRVLKAVSIIREMNQDICISIDTFRASVASAALEAGADLINDVSGGRDDEMLDTIAKYKVPYVLMHMRGKSENMQDLTHYEDILAELLQYFDQKIAFARNKGIKDIIIDLGFGFAKTLDQNYFLLQNLALFRSFQCPILLGVSRKSMIYKALGKTAEQALNGTSVLHAYGLTQGANILRVHDPKEAIECVSLIKKLYTN